MASQYEIDTKLIEILIGLCLAIGLFYTGFASILTTVGGQAKFVQNLQMMFMLMFTLFLCMLFGLFIKWLNKYRTSLIGYLRK